MQQRLNGQNRKMMIKDNILLKNWKWIGLLIVLLTLQMILLLYYGQEKSGYHEDEYYSYYSTNRTAGLTVPDREWVDQETYRREFVVQEGEQFNYDMVKQVQSWDVHPPLFYYLLHTVSSIFPGVFSKWIGISVNMLAFGINFFLLAWLSFMVTDRNKKLTFLIAAVHGFNAAIVSGVMFIRMYEWLTLFVLLCACVHVRGIKTGRLKLITFYIPLMATIYLGFLTQYYYIIFHFFIGAGFCIWLLIDQKKILGCLKYGAACAVALAAAILTYPASLAHIFRGYRGTGAATEFFDTQNTGERLGFFFGLVNDYLFDGALPLILVLLMAMGIFLAVVNRKRGNPILSVNREMAAVWAILSLACWGYFLTVSKTALMLYESSNRYQLPIYGIVLLLVIAGLYTLGRGMITALGAGRIWNLVGFLVLSIGFLLVDFRELTGGKVLFLYKEEEAITAFSRDNAKIPAVIMYHEATPYHVWWLSAELMEHEKVYFMNEDNHDKITDEELNRAQSLIVYAAEGEEEKALRLLLESNENLSGYRNIGEKSIFQIYLLE